jgi:hypothetical protein
MAQVGDLCNCQDCPQDPNLTCSYAGADVSVMTNYVSNAFKGDMILCPGGDNGQIGGLLHQLDPPQHYSHMGLFVTNHDLIRHCTASPGRLTAPEYYTGSILGVKVPADGLPVDHLQFGWPGTITQSVEQAFYADRYAAQNLTPPGSGDQYHGADLTDLDSSATPKKTYRIGALSFETVDGFDTLIVKPCPLLETSDVNAALNRVADEALKIYAHYRFYAFTDGAIAESLNRIGPPGKVVASMPDREPITGKWLDWADPTKVKWIDVPDTVPAVCSSIVWQSVRNAIKTGGPKIKLDWAELKPDALGEAGGACRRSLEPDWKGDTRDPFTIDGLYFYDEESRKRAAIWLNESMTDKVFTGLKETLHAQGGVSAAIATSIDVVGRGAFIAAAVAGSGAVVALLVPILTPAVAIVLDAVFADQLIELLYDMPQDIANQVCNSFAFDCHRGFPNDTSCVDGNANPIKDVDSSNWSDAPGVGRAVSPDNIHMFWDAPGPSNQNVIQGIYGFNQPVGLVSYVMSVPICRLVKSTGTARIRGQVKRQGQNLFGADVEIACQHTVTRADMGYELLVRSGGQYKVTARYVDPVTGTTLYGEAITGKPNDPPIAAGSTLAIDVLVTEPPKCLRKVAVTGHIRIDDVYLTGVDHDDQNVDTKLFVQWGVAHFNYETGTWNIDPTDPIAAMRHFDHAIAKAGVGDANAELLIEVTANQDLSVKVKFTGTIGDKKESREITVHDGETKPLPEFDLDTGGPFNDRAYFRDLVIANFATNTI